MNSRRSKLHKGQRVFLTRDIGLPGWVGGVFAKGTVGTILGAGKRMYWVVLDNDARTLYCDGTAIAPYIPEIAN